MRAALRLAAALCGSVLCGLVLCGRSSAQRMGTQVGIVALGGLERGAGRDGSAVVASPLQLELNARFWTDEADELLLGGGLRAEINGIGSVAVVPRAELRERLGDTELRPGLAFPVYLAPLTLLGPEVSLGWRVPLSNTLGLLAAVQLTAFIAGNNLPRNTTLVQISGGLGVDLTL